MNEQLKIALEEGVFDIKNGSAKLYFDDEGLLQRIDFEKNYRKREGEPFTVRPVTGGKAHAHYGHDSVLLQVVYETTWKRKLASNE